MQWHCKAHQGLVRNEAGLHSCRVWRRKSSRSKSIAQLAGIIGLIKYAMESSCSLAALWALNQISRVPCFQSTQWVWDLLDLHEKSLWMGICCAIISHWKVLSCTELEFVRWFSDLARKNWHDCAWYTDFLSYCSITSLQETAWQDSLWFVFVRSALELRPVRILKVT